MPNYAAYDKDALIKMLNEAIKRIEISLNTMKYMLDQVESEDGCGSRKVALIDPTNIINKIQDMK